MTLKEKIEFGIFEYMDKHECPQVFTDELRQTIAEDVILTVPRGSEKNLKANILVSGLIKAPISAGQELGQLQVSLDGEALIDIPLVAEKNIPKSGIFSQLFDWIILLFTQLLS